MCLIRGETLLLSLLTHLFRRSPTTVAIHFLWTNKFWLVFGVNKCMQHITSEVVGTTASSQKTPDIKMKYFNFSLSSELFSHFLMRTHEGAERERNVWKNGAIYCNKSYNFRIYVLILESSPRLGVRDWSMCVLMNPLILTRKLRHASSRWAYIQFEQTWILTLLFLLFIPSYLLSLAICCSGANVRREKNDKLHGFYRKLLNGKKDHCLLENDINYDRVCIQREWI